MTRYPDVSSVTAFKRETDILMTSDAQRANAQKCEGPYEDCSSGRYHMVSRGRIIDVLGRKWV